VNLPAITSSSFFDNPTTFVVIPDLKMMIKAQGSIQKDGSTAFS
jgi:hypothetical protein